MRQTHFCPCGSSHLYNDCCGRYVSGQQIPETPEKLMRSRYSAYAKGELGYIESTMKNRALAEFDAEETRAWLASLRWESLKVGHSEISKENPALAYVGFVATYKHQGKRYQIRERSEFIKEGNRWFYVGGQEEGHHCGTECRH
jgi:SEC-C motif-containing protein